MLDENPNRSVSPKVAEYRATLQARADQAVGAIKTVPVSTWQWLITAIIVIWSALTLGKLFWLLTPTPVVAPAVVSDLPKSSRAGATADINQLKQLTPFGRYVERAPEPEPEPAPVNPADMEKDASDTSLNLVLRGVVASSDQQRARALIARGDRQANYAIGDVMPEGNNVTLERILPNRVILKNNGRYESLWLYNNDKNGQTLFTSQSAPVAPPVASQFKQVERPAASPFAHRPQPSPQMDNEVAVVAGSNPALAELGNSLTDVVSMSLHRENGQVVGYKIRPGRNVDMFNSFGLKADDVVTAVNGMPLNNPGQIMEIYRNLTDATSANLEIRRGDSTVNVDINLQ